MACTPWEAPVHRGKWRPGVRGKVGLIVERPTTQVSSLRAVAKRYRHSWKQQGSGGTASAQDRRPYVQTIVDELIRRFDSRRPRARSFLSDPDMWVQPEVWAEVTSLVTKATAPHEQRGEAGSQRG